MFTPRDYQVGAVENARQAIREGIKRMIIVAPTGSGKTVMAAMITQSASEKKKKVLFLAHRRELIFQAQGTIESTGLSTGIIMAGEQPDHSADIQIASMQTYNRRMDLDDLECNRWWHDADIVFVDEAHSAISPSYMKIIQAYGDKKIIIGLTATPCRRDGRGLGEIFQRIIPTIGIRGLIDQGYLVPFRYFAPSTPDLDGVPMVAGDYNVKVLGERVNKPKLIGDIYQNWSMIAPERSTIIFATNVNHSLALEAEFNNNGIRTAHIDANTDSGVRKRIFAGFMCGDIQVLVNVGIACEGTDLPIASCIVLARPTKSLGRFIQMGGRGSRLYPEGRKHNCCILDHAGCLYEHGLLEEEHDWTLDGKSRAWSKSQAAKKEKGMSICPVCHKVLVETTICPDCGSSLKRFGKSIDVKDGDLKEVGKAPTMLEKREFFGMAKKWQETKGYRDGWTAHIYKEKFKVWPRVMDDVIPIEPDQAFKNFVKHLAIKRSYAAKTQWGNKGMKEPK